MFAEYLILYASMVSSIDRVSVFQPEFFFSKKNRERVRKMSDKEKGKEVIEFTASFAYSSKRNVKRRFSRIPCAEFPVWISS